MHGHDMARSHDLAVSHMNLRHAICTTSISDHNRPLISLISMLVLCDLRWECINLHQDTPRILLISGSNVHKSLVMRTPDIPTLFIAGQKHLCALMCHIDGHLVVFSCMNSNFPRTN